MPDINRDRLRELIDVSGRSMREISRAAGLGETAVRDIINRKSRDPGLATMANVAAVLGVDVASLLLDGEQWLRSQADIRPQFLTVRYRVQAGHWYENDVEDSLGQPPRGAPPNPRYATYRQWLEEVVGDSVDLKIRPGMYAHVVDSKEMGYMPAPGDWVVVERTRDQGAVRERTIKQVAMRDDGTVELWPRSSNPKWSAPIVLTDGAKPGEDVVAEIVGLVISAIDPDF